MTARADTWLEDKLRRTAHYTGVVEVRPLGEWMAWVDGHFLGYAPTREAAEQRVTDGAERARRVAWLDEVSS